MARKKVESLGALSAAELFELAKQREEEEMEAVRATRQQRLAELRERRRELLAEHNKAMAAIDREMRSLGASGGRRAGGRRAKSEGGNLTDKVEELLARGEMTIKELKATLEKAGFATTNLGQTLAYLKRNGRIDSPARATYTLAK